ncbi:MAG: GHKL domain-containing protein [Clostridiales bacterium]|nr:GHKL domain-containing protein [Clostridiales bacterium]
MISDILIIIELFAYLYCLAELFGKKLKIDIYLVVYIILDMFLMVGIDQYGFPEYLISLSYICMFVYGMLCYRESIKLTVVNCFIAAMVVAVLQLMLFLPSYSLFYVKYENIDINELIINTISLLVIILCSRKINIKKLSDFFIKRDKLIVGVSILILCGLILNFYQMREEGAILKEIYVQMIYFILLFLFVIYEWQKSRVEAEKRKAQLEMNSLYYEAYDKLIMLVRERQHDMKNHINAILSMIYTTDNYEELTEKQKEYCGYVIEQNEKTKLVLASGNPLIAGFMYSKIQEAESKCIEVEYEIEIKKETLVVPEYELVEMMGILTDNAIEALTNVDADTEGSNPIKKIFFSIKDTERNIELVVANTSAYYEDDMTARFFENGYSSKGKGRGIGLSKLKRLVHERNGNIIVSNEKRGGENCLIFTVVIPKEKRQKS